MRILLLFLSNLQGSGTAYFDTPQGGVINNVGSSSAVLAIYQDLSWQFQVDHWYFNIMGKILLPQGEVNVPRLKLMVLVWHTVSACKLNQTGGSFSAF